MSTQIATSKWSSGRPGRPCPNPKYYGPASRAAGNSPDNEGMAPGEDAVEIITVSPGQVAIVKQQPVGNEDWVELQQVQEEKNAPSSR